MIENSFTGYLERLICDHCNKQGPWIDKFDEETMAVTWGLDNGWSVESKKDDICPECQTNLIES